MGEKIPEPIRRNVLREWLEGLPRRQIARDNQIGTGTVSEIVKASKEKDSEARIDVLREAAVMLRREGLNVDTFLESIHLKRFLDEIGLKENLEEFARHLDVHCFKRGLTPDTFMNLVANMSSLSDEFGVPVEELPGRINRSKELLDGINLQIQNQMIKLDRVAEYYNITMTDLEEYNRNRPLVETLKAKDMELEKERERRIHSERELVTLEHEWCGSQHEIELVNEELELPIEFAELYDLAKDLFLHASKYADVIRTIRQSRATGRLAKMTNGSPEHAIQELSQQADKTRVGLLQTQNNCSIGVPFGYLEKLKSSNGDG